MTSPSLPSSVTSPSSVTVVLTEDGNLRLTAEVAERFFPSDALVAAPKNDELWLYPLVGPEGGGLLLKQRNSRGDRSALVREALVLCPQPFAFGERSAVWDDRSGALRVSLRVLPGGPASRNQTTRTQGVSYAQPS